MALRPTKWRIDSANTAAEAKLALVRQLITVTPAPNTPPATDPTEAGGAATTLAAPSSAAPAIASDAEQRVRQRVTAWAKAWASKDAEAYLSFYAANFQVPGGRSRSAWEAERRRRVGGKPGKISVDLEDVKVEMNGDTARVSFRQHYGSYNFDASANKTLELINDGGEWRIRREAVSG